MFKNPFSFQGRIRRTEFGLSLIIYSIAMGIGAVCIVMLSMATLWGYVLLPFLLFAGIWFRLAQSVKRSHDVGYSGWYILIPFYGIYLIFADSQFGANRYGPNPKNLGNNAPEIEHIGTQNF